MAEDMTEVSTGADWSVDSQSTADLSRPSPPGRRETNDRAYFDGAPDAMLILDAQWKIRRVNAEFERMLGYRQKDLRGRPCEDLLPVRFRDSDSPLGMLAAELRHAVDGTGGEFYARRKDNTEIPVKIKASRLENREIVASFQDTTEQDRGDAALRHALSLLGATLESTADGILVVTHDGQIASANRQFVTMWGIPDALLEAHDDAQVMSFVLDQLTEPEEFVAKVRELYGHPDSESNDTLEFRDGRTFERYSRPQRVADVVVGRVWSFRDVTARRQAEAKARTAIAELAEQAEQLKRLAFRDGLTGLANRVLLNERLEHALAGRDARSVSVLLLDLDDFKEVNDILGHQAGDQMLIEVGKRLGRCVRAGDTVARLGGDEFVILLAGHKDPEAVAQRIVATLNMPIHIAGKELHATVSLGLAGEDGIPLLGSELISRADIAMYAAKAAGKNCYLRFRPDMMTTLLARTDVEQGLRHAVERNEIVVHFQPIFNAAAGRMTQMEALARWQRPEGLVAPLDFIPVAEGSGLINAIGREVLAQACRQLRSWLGESELNSVAVNVSGVQLRESDFAQRILDVVSECGVRSRQVVLEVTESVFLHPGRNVTDQLTFLREHGIRVSIDDFGTGYSSLGRLHDLPLDALKIDKTFVDMIKTGTEKLPIVSSMIDMAHNLGLQVTAEGVETETQATRLLSLGCDSLQGYLLSRPQALVDLPDALERSGRTIRALLGTGV